MLYQRLMITAFCVACVSVASAESLLVNGGYETGDVEPWDHWQFVDPNNPVDPPEGQAWTVTTDNPHSGDYCAVGWGSNYVFRQVPAVADWQDIVEFSFWARQDDIGGESWDLFFDMKFDNPYDDKPGMGLLTSVTLTSTDWTYYDGLSRLRSFAESMENRFGPETRLISIGVMGTFDTHTYVDDWVLRTPEPGSVVLLGVGCGVLLRRRR